MRRLLSAASKLTAEAPSPKTAARKRLLTLYHGSVVAGLTEIKIPGHRGERWFGVPSDQFGTYFTKTRWHADFYAGKRGTVYVVRARPKRILRSSGVWPIVTAKQHAALTAEGYDCILCEATSPEYIVLDPSIIEIVRAEPSQHRGLNQVLPA
jgi:hypothetical protein